MIICDKKICTGCAACYSGCPVKCITMKYDAEGFLFPIVDEEKCIECNKCKEICPSLNELDNNNDNNPTTIGCWHKNADIVKMSSSGGAFSAIAEYTFANNGVVIGCAMDKTLIPHHMLANNCDELKIMRGSKYLQSEIRDIYIKTRELLDKDINVLFVGCPCHIAGLYAYLGDHHVYNNLITVDLVCHGVGSKKFFDKYVDEINNKYKDQVKMISFRNKGKPGNSFVTKLSFVNRSPIYIPAIKDPYMSCYLQRAIYRHSCYRCSFAALPRIADITIGDFAGINREIISKEDYYSGVSLMLINNENAKNHFQKFEKNLYWIERPLKEATSTNVNIYKPSVMPDSRNILLNDSRSTKELRDRYCKFKLRVHIANLLGEDITRFLKALLRR